jgi:hypothetical protein
MIIRIALWILLILFAIQLFLPAAFISAPFLLELLAANVPEVKNILLLWIAWYSLATLLVVTLVAVFVLIIGGKNFRWTLFMPVTNILILLYVAFFGKPFADFFE